jgi:parvulin-like peptidyl-prolyl isomerase
MKRFVLLVLCLASTASARPPTGATAPIDHVIAVVDGRAIWQSELEELYVRNNLTKPTFDQSQSAVEALIDNAIVENEAVRLHLDVTTEEIDQAFAMIKQENHIDDAQLDKALAEQHYTRTSYRDEIERQLRGAKLFQLAFATKVQVSEDEVKKRYDEVKKADPKLGALETEHDKVKAALFNEKAAAAQGAWLNQKRATAHVERHS